MGSFFVNIYVAEATARCVFVHGDANEATPSYRKLVKSRVICDSIRNQVGDVGRDMDAGIRDE
jgi:hypothetical protein